MSSSFYEAVEDNPIIAAVKNMNDLEVCCSLEDIRVVFILFGDICSVKEIVGKGSRQGCNGPCGSDQWAQQQGHCS